MFITYLLFMFSIIRSAEIIFRSDTPNFDLEYHPLYDSTAEACTMIELLETHAHYAQKYASCYMTAILYFLQSDVMFNPESVGSDWHPEECVDVFSGLLHLSTGSGSKATANRRSKTSSSVRLAETTGVSDSAAPHVIDSNNGFGVTGEQRSFFIREDVHVAEIQSQLVHSSSGSLSPRSAAESPRSLQTSMVPTPIAGLGSSGPGTHGLVEATNEISGESATGLQTLLLLSSLRRYPRYLDCVCMRLHNYLVFMSTSLFTFVTVNTMHASAIAAPKEMLGNHTASASAADTVNSDLGNQSSNWKIHLLAPNE